MSKTPFLSEKARNLLTEDDAIPDNDYDLEMSDKTKSDDKGRIKKMKKVFVAISKVDNSFSKWENNMVQFVKLASHEDLDRFLGKFLKAGCFVEDRKTKEEKLPTGATFNTLVSFVKRFVTRKCMRSFNFQTARQFEFFKKKMTDDIRENGQIYSIPTEGVTEYDRKIIDQLHIHFDTVPSVLIEKIRYDFAKVGAFRSEEIWNHLYLSDFYIGTIEIQGTPRKCIKMKVQKQLHPKTRKYSVNQDLMPFILVETMDELCPVRSYEYYMSRIHPSAIKNKLTLFLLDDQGAVASEKIWFKKKPMPKNRREKYFPIMLSLIKEHVNPSFEFAEHYTGHSLRTDAIRRMIEQGIPQSVIASKVGHKSIRAQENYLRKYQNVEASMAIQVEFE